MRGLRFGLATSAMIAGSTLGLGLVVFPGCGSNGVAVGPLPSSEAPDAAAVPPRNIGEHCSDALPCRPGLACVGSVCQAARSSELGTPCIISAECKDGLYCGPERTCATAGNGDPGAPCSSDAQCKSRLRCNIVGFAAECQPEGTADVGGACARAGDCLGGLLCANKVCAPPPPSNGGPPLLAIPTFPGVPCETETGPVTAHFRVPRGQGDGDFFRLPFPNDIRRLNGRPNLQGFPTPGSDLLGYDLVDRWLRFLEQTADGFSIYPTVTFRFSGEISFEALEGATKWVDLTPGEGSDLGHNWSATTASTAYVCANSVSFRPRTGEPLKVGHTYAVLVTNGAKAKDGTAIGIAPDLAALLGASNPGGELAAAWVAYTPLRVWATAKAFALTSVVNAAVFTVGNHDAIAKKLPAAVAAAPAPAATSWVKCGPGVVSPCAQAADVRGCPPVVNPAFDEIHALVTLPLFQEGNLPFMEPADKGGFVLDGTGQPALQGNTQVCMSLSVPTGTAPTSGWPLVVYAHGTGGSFRSHVTEGVAARLANVEGTKIAVLGIDQVGHGTRRGTSTAQPQAVFFNFANPAAARGNVLQGAADQLALLRFARGLVLAAGSSPTGQEIRFDRIGFWGHSQGATEGAIAMPYATDVTGVLLSGVGGSLIDSLLTKESPVNISAAAPAVLSDAPANVNSVHPVLALLQNAIDPADPLDHARPITARPIFVPYGQKDTYSTPATQLTYVVAAKLGVAQHPVSVAQPDDLDPTNAAGQPDTLLPVPVTANLAGITAIVRQYAPTDYDGHFVVFRDATAKLDADRFLADVVLGVSPRIGR
jgi:hypothetical protein